MYPVNLWVLLLVISIVCLIITLVVFITQADNKNISTWIFIIYIVLMIFNIIALVMFCYYMYQYIKRNKSFCDQVITDNCCDIDTSTPCVQDIQVIQEQPLLNLQPTQPLVKVEQVIMEQRPVTITLEENKEQCKEEKDECDPNIGRVY